MTNSKNYIEERVETLARLLAAEKMGLQQDVFGRNLPDELWKQCEMRARFLLGVVV